MANVKITLDRRIHILDGDRTGGGHRAGNGLRGKTEFPAGWSDDKIIDVIESVTNDPTLTRAIQPNGRVRLEGYRDGVGIRVILDPARSLIWTAHPINMSLTP